MQTVRVKFINKFQILNIWKWFPDTSILWKQKSVSSFFQEKIHYLERYWSAFAFLSFASNEKKFILITIVIVMFDANYNNSILLVKKEKRKQGVK